MKKLRISVEGKTYEVEVEVISDDSATVVPSPTNVHGTPIVETAALRDNGDAQPKPAAAGALVSPMASTIVKVHVKEGDAVKGGQTLFTLDAMKMETKIRAPQDGLVKTIQAKEGEAVKEGQTLLIMG